jgi:hypothetical protein
MERRLSKPALCCLLFLVAKGVQGVELADGRLNINTYGSIGATRTLDAGVAYRNNYTFQPAVNDRWTGKLDNRVGLQAAWQVNEQIALIGQGLVSRNGDNDLEAGLPWAYLRWRPDPNWEARLGRFRQTLFLITDSFDVGYAHPWVRPPVELYSMVGEMTSVDGAQLRYRHAMDGYSLGATFHAGTSRIERQAYDTYNPRNLGLTLALSNPNLTLQGTLISADADTRVAAVDRVADLVATQNPEVAREYRLGSSDGLLYGALGMRYEKGGWLFMSEAATTRLKHRALTDRNAWYLTVGKTIGDWTPYLTYSQLKMRHWRAEDRLTGVPLQAINALLERRYQNQKTWSLGVRWDFMEGMALKGQWDRVRPETYGLQAARLPDDKRHFDVLSVVMDWSF